MNKKGFTLMELLAVIVILSVLILLAMPAVLRLMNKSKSKAYFTEYNSVEKICKTAYADLKFSNPDVLNHNSVVISLYTLKNLGYTDKNFTKPVNNMDKYGACLFNKDEEQIELITMYTDGTYLYFPNSAQDYGLEGYTELEKDNKNLLSEWMNTREQLKANIDESNAKDCSVLTGSEKTSCELGKALTAIISAVYYIPLTLVDKTGYDLISNSYTESSIDGIFYSD